MPCPASSRLRPVEQLTGLRCVEEADHGDVVGAPAADVAVDPDDGILADLQVVDVQIAVDGPVVHH